MHRPLLATNPATGGGGELRRRVARLCLSVLAHDRGDGDAHRRGLLSPLIRGLLWTGFPSSLINCASTSRIS